MSKKLWLFLVFFLAGLLLACTTPNPQPAGLTPIPSLAPQVSPTLAEAVQGSTGGGGTAGGAASAAIGAGYFEQRCTTCHGPQGEGVDGPALRNDTFVKNGTDQDIFNVIANGRPNTKMPAWAQENAGPFTNDQINAVVGYIKTLQGVAELPAATPMPQSTEEANPEEVTSPEDVAKPSNPGDPGQAVSLTGNAQSGLVVFGQYCAFCHGPAGVDPLGLPNPGSEDGVVPALSPIDVTLVQSDPATNAANVDLFIEHGSVPGGDGPKIMMPAFGDQKLLLPQQIADVISYILSLNGVTWP
jgi:mono/diheme cytochrome c family protein